jgi:hypothetical protein
MPDKIYAWILPEVFFSPPDGLERIAATPLYGPILPYHIVKNNEGGLCNPG